MRVLNSRNRQLWPMRTASEGRTRTLHLSITATRRADVSMQTPRHLHIRRGYVPITQAQAVRHIRLP